MKLPYGFEYLENIQSCTRTDINYDWVVIATKNMQPNGSPITNEYNAFKGDMIIWKYIWEVKK